MKTNKNTTKLIAMAAVVAVFMFASPVITDLAAEETAPAAATSEDASPEVADSPTEAVEPAVEEPASIEPPTEEPVSEEPISDDAANADEMQPEPVICPEPPEPVVCQEPVICPDPVVCPAQVICPEPVIPEPCPECPPPPKCPTCPTLVSNDALLAGDRDSRASASLGVLRDELALVLSAKKTDKDYVLSLINEIDIFMDMYREMPMAAEALYLKAELYGRSKLNEARLVTLAKLLFEYPEGEFAKKAVIGIRGLFTGKLKKAFKYDKGLSKGSKEGQWADRYANAIEILHEFRESKFLPFLIDEYDEFLGRYPRHKFAEKVLRFKSEGYVSMKEYDSAAFTLLWLVKLYPESTERSAAMFDLALVYEENLKDSDKAVQTFELLVNDYPDSEQTLASYQRAAILFDKKLKDAAGALKSLEAIVTKYPGGKAALDAFRYMADLQESNKIYPESVQSLNRMADMFKGDPAAIEALKDASKIASGKMKDYALQITVLRRIVDEYPDLEEAIIALDTIAATTFKQLGDTAGAVSVYESLIAQYPDHKLAGNARKKLEKLKGN